MVSVSTRSLAGNHLRAKIRNLATANHRQCIDVRVVTSQRECITMSDVIRGGISKPEHEKGDMGSTWLFGISTKRINLAKFSLVLLK